MTTPHQSHETATLPPSQVLYKAAKSYVMPLTKDSVSTESFITEQLVTGVPENGIIIVHYDDKESREASLRRALKKLLDNI